MGLSFTVRFWPCISYKTKDQFHIEMNSQNYEHSTKKIVLVQTATNVNMILNFGRNLTELIKQSDIEYHVIYSKNQNKSNESVIAGELENLNATLHTVPLKQELSLKSLFGLFSSFLRIFLLLRKIKPDVLHTRGTLMGIIGRAAAFFARVDRVFHHQDDFYHREDTLSPARKRIFKTLEKLLAKTTTKLLFVSETIKEEAIEIGIPEHKCINVGHDLHPIFIQHLSSEVRRSDLINKYMGSNSEKFIVGTLSRIEEFKGIDTIVAVAKKVQQQQADIKFFVRGTGSKFEKYQRIIQEEALSDTIFLTKDYLPTEEIPPLFKSFDVFFLPTRREGFGMVFAEAMSMGIPVVCPKIYPVVEVVPNDMGCLIEAEDVEGYTNAILSLYHDEQKRSMLASKAREYAIDRWGGKKSAQLVLDTLIH